MGDAILLLAMSGKNALNSLGVDVELDFDMLNCFMVGLIS